MFGKPSPVHAPPIVHHCFSGAFSQVTLKTARSILPLSISADEYALPSLYPNNNRIQLCSGTRITQPFYGTVILALIFEIGTILHLFLIRVKSGPEVTILAASQNTNPIHPRFLNELWDVSTLSKLSYFISSRYSLWIAHISVRYTFGITFGVRCMQSANTPRYKRLCSLAVISELWNRRFPTWRVAWIGQL